MKEICILVMLCLRFCNAGIKSQYYKKVELEKDGCKMAEKAETATVNKPELFTSKSIMCATYCMSVFPDCLLAGSAGHDACHFIKKENFPESYTFPASTNSLAMFINSGYRSDLSNPHDFAADAKVTTSDVETSTHPQATIVSKCSTLPDKKFCTTDGDSYITIDLGKSRRISTILFYYAPGNNKNTIQGGNIHIGNGGDALADPPVKTNIFENETITPRKNYTINFAHLVPNVLLCIPLDHTGEAKREVLTTMEPRISIYYVQACALERSLQCRCPSSRNRRHAGTETEHSSNTEFMSNTCNKTCRSRIGLYSHNQRCSSTTD
ncbi:Galactose-binding domain-like [Trinorchestia longiramus]|nr:Galactose-binding domain-like [Trinorchestia longiramus]